MNFFHIYTFLYWVERYNCRHRKDDMIPFPFNEDRFSFFVADHLVVGQLCTNPKSDRSLLSCLKVTQCSTSEIGDALQYNSCSLPIQVMTTDHCQHPQNANLNVWSYVENITNMTSHNTKASLITAIRRVFAELPPALVEKACSQFLIRIKAVIEAEESYIE